MKFVFPRDRVVPSVYGHTIHFPKGVPTHVPPEMVREVIAVGGLPEDGAEIDVDPEPQAKGAAEPTAPDARRAAIFAAFEALILRGKREDFTAGGQPHPKALARELGWSLSNKERDLEWVAFQAAEK